MEGATCLNKICLYVVKLTMKTFWVKPWEKNENKFCIVTWGSGPI